MTGPVLVTGAAGFVGSHLLDWLARSEQPIVAWRRPGTEPYLSATNVRWCKIELLDQAEVEQAVADVRPSAIYHLAGAAHVAESWRATLPTFEGNVLATHRLFEALRKVDLRPRVVVSGSAMIYGALDRPLTEDDPIAPASPYATSKLAQEMLAARAWSDDGVPTLLARSFNHVGPRQDPSYVASSTARQIALIEAGHVDPVLAVGNLDPRRDLTDVRDTVRAYVAMMTSGRPGIPYNVCSGRAVSIRSLVEGLVCRADVAIQIVQDPERFRPNDTPVLVGDHSRLTKDTGWQPEIPFEQTLDDLLAYWRERIKSDS